MNRFASILLLGALCLVLGVAAQVSVPPQPPTGHLSTNQTFSVPTAIIGGETNAIPVIVVPAPPASGQWEWELTFEWVAALDGTNAAKRTYPIRVQVPFEADKGFVFIRARKVAK